MLQLCVTSEPGRQLRGLRACMLLVRQLGHLYRGRKLSLVPVKSQSQLVLNKTALSYSFSERLENKNTHQTTPAEIMAERHAMA